MSVHEKEFDLLQVHIVGFSGQRTLQNPSAVADEVRNYLTKVACSGRLMALSSLAGSTDLIFAKVALDLGVPLVIILTLPREELRRNFSHQEAPDFDRVLEKATKTEMLPTAHQPEAATHLGQKLVDEADVVLAVSDSAETKTAGDTADVIAYATRRGRPVVHIQETANGISVKNLKSEHDLTDQLLSIERLQEMLGEPPAAPVIPEKLVEFFKVCDTQATNTAPKVRRYVLNIVLANAIASIAGGVNSSFHHSAAIGTVLTIIKFGSFFLGLGIFAVLRHRQSRNRWLGLRLKAEVCRSAMATWNLPIPVEPISADEVPELRQLMQSLRYFRTLNHKSHADVTLAGFKSGYGIRRLIDQYTYFQAQARSADKMSAQLTPLYWLLSGGALFISGASLVLQSIYGQQSHLSPPVNFIFVMIPIVAPAIASWIIAWQAIESVSRKRARCVEMERLIHQSLVDLIHSHSWEAVRHVVKKVERQLLMEVLEWYSFVKYSS